MADLGKCLWEAISWETIGHKCKKFEYRFKYISICLKIWKKKFHKLKMLMMNFGIISIKYHKVPQKEVCRIFIIENKEHCSHCDGFGTLIHYFLNCTCKSATNIQYIRSFCGIASWPLKLIWKVMVCQNIWYLDLLEKINFIYKKNNSEET